MLEGRKRVLEEMKTKADKEMTKEKMHSEVLKISYERQQAFFFGNERRSPSAVKNLHPGKSIRRRKRHKEQAL